jgi:hypothetical protein
MAFDWLTFLNQHSIPFVTRGPNIGSGEAGVRCPMCGSGDHGQHLAINLSGRGWICRRNNEHRGVSPVRLIAGLLNISAQQAATMCGQSYVALPGDEHSFGDQIAVMLGASAPAPRLARRPARKLEMPPSFVPITTNSMMACFCREYMQARGYSPEEVLEIGRLYDLRCTMVGAFNYRVIFPIRHRAGLMNWTGRAIAKAQGLRYKALSTDEKKAKAEGLPKALLPLHECLWQEAALHEGGRCLVLNEGPMDSMRVDFYGRARDIRATCMFTKSLGPSQLSLLAKVAPKFQRRVLMLDASAIFDAQRMMDKLLPFCFELLELPAGPDDPAELTKLQMDRLIA